MENFNFVMDRVTHWAPVGAKNRSLHQQLSDLAAEHEAQGGDHPPPDVPLLLGVAPGPDVGGQAADHVPARHLLSVLQ